MSQAVQEPPVKAGAYWRKSWERVAPFWPLDRLAAVNPLHGWIEMPIEKALSLGALFFGHRDLPGAIDALNRETIKWCQPFFDKGQARFSMPYRERGLYGAWRALAKEGAAFPKGSIEAIEEGCEKLAIPREERELFCTLLLTTLPGYAAHVKYRAEWAEAPEPELLADFLALRLSLATLFWPEAKALLEWYHRESAEGDRSAWDAIVAAEGRYRKPLCDKLAGAVFSQRQEAPAMQVVFCIDVRSEPMRHALETSGSCETFGFAGFFGLPIAFEDALSKEVQPSCPVLFKPEENVVVKRERERRYHIRVKGQTVYQALKYAFHAPFALVEMLGLAAGIGMAARTFAPRALRRSRCAKAQLSYETISLEKRCALAEGALVGMGLTARFARRVVFCGHGSATENNPFATALDCGACGGRCGGENAQLLAEILSDSAVRACLRGRGIAIPEETRFLAAQHNTTTGALHLYDDDAEVSAAFAKACGARCRAAERASTSWAEVRPEWGLARNGAFIVGPRAWTQEIDLGGRAFLHSYEPEQDPDGAILRGILTAPMIVAHWINSQYLFSSLDPVAYGAGSKVTLNVAGKIGVMQGNASDLMHGLPLQSVALSDRDLYHEPVRLLTVIYGKRAHIEAIIEKESLVRTLIANGWITLTCREPDDSHLFTLQRDFSWR